MTTKTALLATLVLAASACEKDGASNPQEMVTLVQRAATLHRNGAIDVAAPGAATRRSQALDQGDAQSGPQSSSQ